MITFWGPRLMRRGSVDATRRGGGPLVRTKQTQRVEQSFRSPITRTRARHGGGYMFIHIYIYIYMYVGVEFLLVVDKMSPTTTYYASTTAYYASTTVYYASKMYLF
jgi:hypothetical protein